MRMMSEPMRSPYLHNPYTDPEAYVYDGSDLICSDCYWDNKTTEAQRRKCEPVPNIEEWEDFPGEGVGCDWCHEYIQEPEENEVDES